jgi:arylsulfatase A-like enzyme
VNLIVLVIDSLRQDHVGTYRGTQPPFPDVPAPQTPNLDAFAKDCIVFRNAYPEGLPTIPGRCALMTGQRTLPFRSWGPLQPADLTIAQILRGEGFVCGLVSDLYHYWGPGMNYHAGFHSWRWIRGQEYDPWDSAPSERPVERYVNANYPAEWRQRVAQFLANTDRFRSEDDWFAAQVMSEAETWLQRNRVHSKVFLWVDCFDPHEPWDPPPAFDTYADARYAGPRLILPMGGFSRTWASPDEVRFLRAMYAGEVAFVDRCLGRFFSALGRLGYLDDSIVVVLADHGHPLDDHGKFLKGADRLYSELLRIPFMIHLPGGRHGGQRSDALVQFQDLLPTLLDLLALRADLGGVHGTSFRPVVERVTDSHRDAIISGYHEGLDRCMRTETWSFIERPIGQSDELYNLREDPQERHNLIEANPDEAVRLSRLFGRNYRARGSVAKGIQGKYELASSGLDEANVTKD